MAGARQGISPFGYFVTGFRRILKRDYNIQTKTPAKGHCRNNEKKLIINLAVSGRPVMSQTLSSQAKQSSHNPSSLMKPSWELRSLMPVFRSPSL